MNVLIRAWVVGGVLLIVPMGCGGDGPPAGTGATGGIGASGGTGATAGTGATGGTGGTAGTSGTGGASGTGGSAGGTGGTGATGGSCPPVPEPFAPTDSPCVTNALCHSCPADVLPPSRRCASDDDCVQAGYVCVPSGCTAEGGGSLGQCQEPPTPSCDGPSDCPPGYACEQVGAGGLQCSRVDSGCSPVTENIDCAPGFTCECGECVDRRVPCDSSFDCPKSHTCEQTATASYCVRIYRDCAVAEDCDIGGQRCVDVDGDGRKECSGELGDGNACVNKNVASTPDETTRCASDAAPICETGNFGSADDAVCGDYGLCRDDEDCRSGFECVALGVDGRRECVPRGPRECDSNADCALNEVCASPRLGGAPRCERGTAE